MDPSCPRPTTRRPLHKPVLPPSTFSSPCPHSQAPLSLSLDSDSPRKPSLAAPTRALPPPPAPGRSRCAPPAAPALPQCFTDDSVLGPPSPAPCVHTVGVSRGTRIPAYPGQSFSPPLGGPQPGVTFPGLAAWWRPARCKHFHGALKAALGAGQRLGSPLGCRAPPRAHLGRLGLLALRGAGICVRFAFQSGLDPARAGWAQWVWNGLSPPPPSPAPPPHGIAGAGPTAARQEQGTCIKRLLCARPGAEPTKEAW